MKIETEILQDAVKKVFPFVAQISTVPVYTHFLLDTRSGTLKVSGFDYEGTCVYDTGFAIDDGEIYATVPAKLFRDDILGIDEDEVDLKMDKNKLAVKTKRHRARIESLPGDEFIMPRYDGVFYPVDPRILDAMERCAAPINEKKKPPVLTGVHLRVEKGVIQAFGTDGARAGRYEVDFGDDTDFNITIPKRMAVNIAKCARGEDDLQISTSENAIIFSTAKTKLTSQLLDGEYPHVWSFFERSREGYNTIAVDGTVLSDALKRSMVFITKTDSYILLSSSQDTLVINATATHGAGFGEVEMDAECGVSVDVALNAQFLYDFARLLKGERVIISVRGKQDPVYLNGLDNFEYVMMPMVIR